MSRSIIALFLILLSHQIFAQHDITKGFSIYPTTSFEYAWLTDPDHPLSRSNWAHTQFYTLGCELTHQESPDRFDYQFVFSTNLSIADFRVPSRNIETTFFQLELAVNPRVFVNPKAKIRFFFAPFVAYQMRFGGLNHESVSYAPHSRVTVKPADFSIGGGTGVRIENGLLIGVRYNHGLIESYLSKGPSRSRFSSLFGVSETTYRHFSRSLELHVTYQVGQLFGKK